MKKKSHPVTGNAGLEAVARLIESNVDQSFTLSDLAKHAGLSPSRLQKSFKAAFGVSPKVFQDAARLRRLKSGLREGENVASAIYGAGYGSSSRVYERSASHIGMTPATYRKGGAGEVISYAVRETVLGPLLMAATERGVCCAQFGDSEDELVEQLTAEFPKARVILSPAQDRPELDAWIDALGAHLSGDRRRPDLPLDLRGTAFQMQVWKFLLSVKEGDVVSYSEVARGIGKPKAVRAAGTACGANKIAVLVPCHRVLRGDGGLGGYRWGIERKRALLDAERRSTFRSK